MSSAPSSQSHKVRFEIRSAERQLLIDGNPAKLGARAFDVLQALFDRRDRVVSKDELFDAVWPGLVVEENNLQVQISTLRKLLGANAITTVPGRGYRFTADVGGAAAGATTAHVAARGERDRAILGNLPAEAPHLYGRAADIDAVQALLAANRLVTVVGTAGVGKTALAHAVAHRLRQCCADGTWWVELARVTDGAAVPSSIAATLSVALEEQAGADLLAHRLRSARLLLVLDNCEHLVRAVADFASAVLSEAPGVRLLVTSQELLRVTHEQVYPLGGLALPGTAELAGAREAGAPALFEARARAADPRFVLNDENLSTVTDICRRLDGVPLAIELAAARVRLFGLQGLHRRLDERFKILTGGARMALRRHQTLHAALEWSHSLLAENEKKVLRRLGAFVGTFDPDSAQIVAAGTDLDRVAVLDLLASLVDKSLVAVDAGATPRCRLLETTRAFALEALGRAGETEATLQRHAIAMAERFETSIEAQRRRPWQECLERYLPDLDDARAALEWCVGAGDRLLQIRLAGAMAWIWRDAGLRPEGRRRTWAAIEQVDAATPARLEARLVGQWAWLAHPVVGPRELAANARAVQLWRTLGDLQELFLALCNQIRFQTYGGEIEQARHNFEEAERLFEPSWPPRLRLTLLRTRSWLFQVQGRLDVSLRADEEVLAIATAWGDENTALGALINIEQIAAATGRLEESVQRNRELQQRLRNDRTIAASTEHFVAANLAISLTRLGRLDEALAAARAALPLLEKADRLVDLLEQSALLAARRGHVEDAARIFGCSERAYASFVVRRDVVEQQQHEECAALLRATFDVETLARLMHDGEALSIEEAVRLAHRS